MNRPETEFYHNLKAAFYAELDIKQHMTRIESNMTGQGIPDVNFCYKGRECWIELKVGDNKLSPMQIAWQSQHRQAGGLVFTLWKKGDGVYIVESLTQIAKATSINEVVKIIIMEMKDASIS